MRGRFRAGMLVRRRAGGYMYVGYGMVGEVESEEVVDGMIPVYWGSQTPRWWSEIDTLKRLSRAEVVLWHLAK